MNILYWFQSIRTPFFDTFFSSVTYLGHELIPIALICIIYWCINKNLAYKIGFTFFASGLLTQTLKISFRVPRPWVIDPNFKPVGNSTAAATSYSFPSGHTQSATSVYASFALFFKKIWVKIICISAFILVAISRMYLGVHTLADVLTAMLITLLITMILFRVFERIKNIKKYDIVISISMLLFSLAIIIYSSILSAKNIISAESLEDCVKSGSAGIAFAIGYYIERKYIDFDVKAKNIIIQIIKVIIGLGIALALKSGLKYIIGDSVIADGARYFILVVFIVVIYPIILNAISKKRRN